MNLKDQLLADHSKINTLYIVDVVGKNEKKFTQLIDLMLSNDPVISPRAAYAVDYCTEKNPELLHHKYDRIMDHLSIIKSQAVLRHVLRMFSRFEIPEKQEGYLFDFCMNTLEINDNDIAVRVNAMQLLYNISIRQPDLKPELKAIFEKYSISDSAGMRSRSSKLIDQLNKEIKH